MTSRDILNVKCTNTLEYLLETLQRFDFIIKKGVFAKHSLEGKSTTVKNSADQDLHVIIARYVLKKREGVLLPNQEAFT